MNKPDSLLQGTGIGGSLSIHPVAAMLARFHDAAPYFTLGYGPVDGADWVTGDELLADGERLQRLLVQVGERYKTTDRAVMSSFFFGDYSWQLITTATAGYLVEKCVPDLSAAKVAFRFGPGGEIIETRLLEGCFAVLEGAHSDHPDARIVNDTDELLGYMQQQLIEGNLATLIAMLHDTTPFKRKALWSAVADRSADMAVWLGEMLGREDECEQEVALLLSTLPLKVGTRVIPVEVGGHREYFLKRGGCCLNYRLEGNERCDSCPLLPLDERIERLREHIRTEHAQEAVHAEVAAL